MFCSFHTSSRLSTNMHSGWRYPICGTMSRPDSPLRRHCDRASWAAVPGCPVGNRAACYNLIAELRVTGRAGLGAALATGAGAADHLSCRASRAVYTSSLVRRVRPCCNCTQKLLHRDAHWQPQSVQVKTLGKMLGLAFCPQNLAPSW